MNIVSSVALGWLGRRVLDWGGLIGGFLWFILKTYSELPPELQAAIGTVLQGHWAELSLGSVAGFISWAWSQRKSWLATVRPQIVTPQGTKVELDQLPASAQEDVVVTASLAPPRRTIANAILEALARKRL